MVSTKKKGVAAISSIEDVRLFQGLSAEEMKEVQSCLHERTFEKGEVLFSEGAPCERIFIVREGRVKFYRTGATGREQILEILKPGDTCACNPGTPNWHCGSTAEAITPCRVWYLSRADYMRLVNANTHLAQALSRLFAERLQMLSNLVEEVSLKDAKKRLIKFLLDMVEENRRKKGDKSILFIPFTREEIAQRLGTSRETVARYLSVLKQENLIDIKPYQIVILDKEGLEKALS